MSFRFKQFSIQDDRCAMKVGTDGVLLGAWSPVGTRILDIGTGSGLIALMLAQRYPQARIDAIDIDEAAIEQARENFQSSVFSQQLATFLSSLQEWKGGPYDLIVSNPPYFRNSLKNPDKGRTQARHTDSLSYAELITHSARLLTDEGRLALILPAEAESEVRGLAASEKLSLVRVTRVYSKENKPVRRVMMEWRVKRQEPAFERQDTLILEDEKGLRSAVYQELTKDFYL